MGKKSASQTFSCSDSDSSPETTLRKSLMNETMNR